MWKFKKVFYSKKTEKVDPVPAAASLSFRKPASIEEIVQRSVMAAMAARQPQRPRDQWLEQEEPDDDFESQHELTYDPAVGEVTKHEKKFLDDRRSEFDRYVTEQKKAARKKAKVQKETAEKSAVAPAGGEAEI